jgi:hypothetical protein
MRWKWSDARGPSVSVPPAVNNKSNFRRKACLNFSKASWTLLILSKKRMSRPSKRTRIRNCKTCARASPSNPSPYYCWAGSGPRITSVGSSAYALIWVWNRRKSRNPSPPWPHLFSLVGGRGRVPSLLCKCTVRRARLEALRACSRIGFQCRRCCCRGLGIPSFWGNRVSLATLKT